jgi:pyrimidine oxygenase
MAATIDDVSGGRAALNMVAGANLREFEQMGALPDDWPAVKYDYAAEWLGVVRRLWSEERVSHEGRWFRLDGCVSGPKPVQRPGPPVLCAGASPAGMAFTAAHADHAFVGGPTPGAVAALARDYRAAAAARGRELGIHTVTMLVLAPTLAQAEDRIAAYEADPDLAAIADHHGEYAKPTAGASLRRDPHEAPPVWFGSRPDPLTPTLLADRLHALFEAGVDGVLCAAADWDRDLGLVEREVLPDLRRRGVVRPVPAP